MKNDYRIKFMTRDGIIRGCAVLVTETLRELARRHDLSPTAAVALGRAAAGCACLAGLLKDNQRVALRFEGDGPLRRIVVECGHDGSLRGTVQNPHAELKNTEGRLDVAGTLGTRGTLTVTRDLGLKTPYTGSVPLITSEIGEDLAWYLADSEQIPSAVLVGVHVDKSGIQSAGGVILQAMPPVDEELIDGIMNRLGNLPSLSGLLSDGETPEMIAARILSDIPYEILEIHSVFFACSCSRRRIGEVLRSLGVAELGRMAAQNEDTEVICEYCLERYVFDPGELAELALGSTLPAGKA